MNSANTLLFGILIFLVTVISVQSLKCYMCEVCNDPFDENAASTVSCSGSCLKAKVGDFVVRSCSDTNIGDTCDEKDGIKGCSCTSDLCNSASGFSVSFPVVCISALILLLRLF
ncbi:uncharacterized protein LOC132743810 [Ruditapes philippinarum]|uniref:uncharacterized protein LOC132743810 n=1 Tax=Ruditapes philippinarum TaxID=129788 RepID=UPI00295BB653|nr:uncharacterized protein LOC132743810 [Ruditapes philippinarum]